MVLVVVVVLLLLLAAAGGVAAHLWHAGKLGLIANTSSRPPSCQPSMIDTLGTIGTMVTIISTSGTGRRSGWSDLEEPHELGLGAGLRDQVLERHQVHRARVVLDLPDHSRTVVVGGGGGGGVLRSAKEKPAASCCCSSSSSR